MFFPIFPISMHLFFLVVRFQPTPSIISINWATNFPDLYWGGDFDVLKSKILAGEISPSEIHFFLGYSGWDAGQLEEELKEDSWLVTDVEEAAVMQEFDEVSWTDFVKKAGNRYSIWEHFPENPTLN